MGDAEGPGFDVEGNIHSSTAFVASWESFGTLDIERKKEKKNQTSQLGKEEISCTLIWVSIYPFPVGKILVHVSSRSPPYIYAVHVEHPRLGTLLLSLLPCLSFESLS